MRGKENIYVNVFYERPIDALCPAHLCAGLSCMAKQNVVCRGPQASQSHC